MGDECVGQKAGSVGENGVAIRHRPAGIVHGLLNDWVRHGGLGHAPKGYIGCGVGRGRHARGRVNDGWLEHGWARHEHRGRGWAGNVAWRAGLVVVRRGEGGGRAVGWGGRWEQWGKIIEGRRRRR